MKVRLEGLIKFKDTTNIYNAMKFLIKIFFAFLLLCLSTFGFAQSSEDKSQPIPKKVWFISASAGVQMSGIKDEDFISKNVAPAITIGGGFWITSEIGLYAGYKGPYFNTIADDDKHYYNFFYAEVLLNITEMIDGANEKRKWNLILHPGAGAFNNMYYGRPNVCLNIGVINSMNVGKNIDLFIDLSAVAGWDIYQGNDDILPSCTFGVTYLFK